MNGRLDLSGYPPPPVLWLTAVIDTVCMPFQCSQWRDSLGIDERSWLAAKVPPLLEHLPTYPSFQDYLKQQNPSWLASSSSSSFYYHYYHYFGQQQKHLQPSIEDSHGMDDSTPSSLWTSMYKYAFETPSTALGDLTTPTAVLVLLCSVLILRLLKSILLPLFSSYGRWMGRRTHGVEWEAANEDRIAKFGEYVFRLLYHSSISVFGVYYFWDKEWWAATPNATMSLYQGFPNHPVEPGMAWYYLLQAAYNVDAMVSLLLISFVVTIKSPVVRHNSKARGHSSSSQFQLPVQIRWSPTVRGDFREMMIHHVITNLLVVGSSLCRLTRIGSMVFLVHDLSDVPVDLSKLANFLKWKWTTLACFLSMVALWVVTRLYILPFTIYRSILTQSHYVVQDGLPILLYVQYRHFFYLLVGLLIVLHFCWFVMFMQIFGTFLKKNECHDLSEHKQGEKQDSNQDEATTTEGKAENAQEDAPPSVDAALVSPKKRVPDEISEEKKDN
ncbi:hypothetical protein ACA910_005079 [Epithemia clementina (nom. ined.)]